ncbi:MAG: class I SAM-dependent methyltransferase [Pseudomonadota bacterium]
MLDLTDNSAAAEAARYYAQNADALIGRYESVSFETVHADLIRHLPVEPGAALDVGAGSGRDAAWLAKRGWSVVAVEPSGTLREGGRRLHPEASIEWIEDTLPGLRRTRALDRKFDLVLLSAVWMHVPPEAEATALSVLAELAAPNAILSISVRMGGDETRRGFYSTDLPHLKRLAVEAGFALVGEGLSRDRFARPDVAWTSIVFRRS